MTNFKDITAALTEQLQHDVGIPSSLEDLETLTGQASRQILQHWLENSEESDPEPKTRCRDCGNYANYISKRVGFIRTQFGLLRFRRAYYVCPDCHQSTCPLDERLNPIESLARLRTKIAGGKPLPVAELAQAWGLGSLKVFNSKNPTIGKNKSHTVHQAESEKGEGLSNQSPYRSKSIFHDAVQSRIIS
jgi:hypothetical protein